MIPSINHYKFLNVRNAKSQELQRYEELLGRQIAENSCGLCLYNVGRVDEEQFVWVYKSHGHIIQEGIVGRTVV
jgi:hypothetical protein